jgi:hypothetical protein
VVMLTSDHGDHLGDHRLMLKGAEQYQASWAVLHSIRGGWFGLVHTREPVNQSKTAVISHAVLRVLSGPSVRFAAICTSYTSWPPCSCLHDALRAVARPAPARPRPESRDHARPRPDRGINPMPCGFAWMLGDICDQRLGFTFHSRGGGSGWFIPVNGCAKAHFGVVNHSGLSLKRGNIGFTEPPRVRRRPFDLSHAAMAGSSSMA